MRRKPPQPDILRLSREVLRFDRFYSRRLHEAAVAARVHESSAAELGIFRELLHGSCAPGWLSWRLDLDTGYLSRNLRQLELMGFIKVARAGDDGRRRQVSLTALGFVAARSLEGFHEDAVRKTLQELPPRQQRRLARAMKTIIDILERDALTNLLECHA